MATHIQIRRATANQWQGDNPTLKAGEFGFETDTNKMKVGNGTSAWNALPYLAVSSGLPTGGTTGQVLAKHSNTDYDTEWIDPNIAQTVRVYVQNADTSQINKGDVVYISGGAGGNLYVKKALATGDATSARTIGLASENLTYPNGKGWVVTVGQLDALTTNVDSEGHATSDGQQLYLSASVAGGWTNVKTTAPAHMVYVARITKSVGGSAGTLYVGVQNGYELDELHNVDNTTNAPTNLQALVFESATNLWKNAGIVNSLTASTGITMTGTQGNLTISNGLIASSPLVYATGTVSINATSANTANYVVQRDASGNFSAGTATVSDLTVGNEVNAYPPIGSVIAFAGPTAPNGWVLCYGQALNTYTYQYLHAIISNNYGGIAYNNGVTNTSGAATTFNVPDMRGRVAAGKDDMGGTAASILGTTSTSANVFSTTVARTLGGAAGSQLHTIVTGESASHTHGSSGAHTHDTQSVDGSNPSGTTVRFVTIIGGSGNVGGAGRFPTNASNALTADGAHTHTSIGSDLGHNNVQPTRILNYIIKY